MKNLNIFCDYLAKSSISLFCCLFLLANASFRNPKKLWVKIWPTVKNFSPKEIFFQKFSPITITCALRRASMGNVFSKCFEPRVLANGRLPIGLEISDHQALMMRHYASIKVQSSCNMDLSKLVEILSARLSN